MRNLDLFSDYSPKTQANNTHKTEQVEYSEFDISKDPLASMSPDILDDFLEWNSETF